MCYGSHGGDELRAEMGFTSVSHTVNVIWTAKCHLLPFPRFFRQHLLQELSRALSAHPSTGALLFCSRSTFRAKASKPFARSILTEAPWGCGSPEPGQRAEPRGPVQSSHRGSSLWQPAPHRGRQPRSATAGPLGALPPPTPSAPAARRRSRRPLRALPVPRSALKVARRDAAAAGGPPRSSAPPALPGWP